MPQRTKPKPDSWPGITSNARPGITDSAFAWLQGAISDTWNVLEYGSGGSTVWFASRVKFIVSIEHDPCWIRLVRVIAKGDGRSMELILAERPYAEAAWSGPFHLAFIDGRDRVLCVEVAMRLVEPGGFLMLDDSQRERYSEAWELLESWKVVHRSVQEVDIERCHTGNETTVWQKP